MKRQIWGCTMLLSGMIGFATYFNAWGNGFYRWWLEALSALLLIGGLVCLFLDIKAYMQERAREEQALFDEQKRCTAEEERCAAEEEQ